MSPEEKTEPFVPAPTVPSVHHSGWSWWPGQSSTLVPQWLHTLEPFLTFGQSGAGSTDNVKGLCGAQNNCCSSHRCGTGSGETGSKCPGAQRMNSPWIYYQNVLMMCVCKENLPYSIRQNITSQKIYFQIHSTANLNEIECLIWTAEYLHVIACLGIVATFSNGTGHCAIKLSFCSSVGEGNWLQSQMVDRITTGKKVWC